MKTLILLLASAVGLLAQTASVNRSTVQFNLTGGNSAPSSGNCDAASEVNRIYVRYGAPATYPQQVYICRQTGTSTYAWEPIGYRTGTTVPAKCVVGDLFFDTDATAGSNVYGCTATDTWTAQAGGSGEFGNGTDPGLITILCGTAPSTPASDKVALYCEGDRLKAKNDAGTVYGIGSRALSFTFGDPAGSALSSGSTTTVYLTVPFACTINAWSIVVDAGTATVKFWRKATGTAIPTSSDSINTSGVEISTGTAVRSTTLSDFTSTSIAANDILAANLTAVSTAKFLNAVLECN